MALQCRDRSFLSQEDKTSKKVDIFSVNPKLVVSKTKKHAWTFETNVNTLGLGVEGDSVVWA